MKKNILLLLIIAVFIVGGAIFAYALTQNTEEIKEKVEMNQEESSCPCGCNEECGGECGLSDCTCNKEVTSSCGCSGDTTATCGVKAGSCGSSSCSGECTR